MTESLFAFGWSPLSWYINREVLAISDDFNLSIDAGNISGNTYTGMLTENIQSISLWMPPQDFFFNTRVVWPTKPYDSLNAGTAMRYASGRVFVMFGKIRNAQKHVKEYELCMCQDKMCFLLYQLVGTCRMRPAVRHARLPVSWPTV